MRYGKVLLLFALLGSLLAACAGENIPSQTVSAVSFPEEVTRFSDADRKTEHPEAVTIALGANGVYPITQGGAYRLTGEQTGQIRIDAQDEIVHLIFDDLTLRSPQGPAVLAVSGAKVVITLPDGTESTVTDSPYYPAGSREEGCIYSACDLTLNGGGSLLVTGYHKDGIRTRDTLKVLDAALSVRCKNDALRGNDGFAGENALLDIQCEGAGILTTRQDKAGRGFVFLSGGSSQIIAGTYGISAAENLYLRDCEANISGILDDITCQGESFVQEGCLP